MRVYIAGPMTGLPDYNFPAFHRAEEQLRGLGHEPLSPARTDDGDTSKPRPYYLRKAIALLLESDAITLLPGWKTSAGARLEMAIAHELELPVVQLDSGSSK